MKRRNKLKRHLLFPCLMLVTLLTTLPVALGASRPRTTPDVTVEDTLPPETETAPETPVLPETPEDPSVPDTPAAPDLTEEPDPEDDAAQAPPETEPLTAEELFSTTLFIGDSRTVGLQEYGGMTGATFFSDVGMSVFTVQDKTVSVPGLGKLTLEELLTEKSFDRIHLMLGINELGYDMNAIVQQYGQVVEYIRELQPDATLYLGANLHVSASRSQSDSIYNNPRLNQLNQQIEALADGQQIIYLDVNPLFDDESGALNADLTGDGTHVYASAYATWSQWLYESMQ